MATNYSILVDVELQTAKAKQQLDALGKGQRVSINSTDLDNLRRRAEDASDSMENLSLTFQQANMMMQKSIEIIAKKVRSQPGQQRKIIAGMEICRW